MDSTKRLAPALQPTHLRSPSLEDQHDFCPRQQRGVKPRVNWFGLTRAGGQYSYVARALLAIVRARPDGSERSSTGRRYPGSTEAYTAVVLANRVVSGRTLETNDASGIEARGSSDRACQRRHEGSRGSQAKPPRTGDLDRAWGSV